MAVHHFGQMTFAPQPGERFERFEPERFGCISVRDELIDGLLSSLKGIKTYRHGTDTPGSGLNEAGVTLIPPSSAGQMASVIKGREALMELYQLLNEADRTQKWLIHFGI